MWNTLSRKLRRPPSLLVRTPLCRLCGRLDDLISEPTRAVGRRWQQGLWSLLACREWPGSDHSLQTGVHTFPEDLTPLMRAAPTTSQAMSREITRPGWTDPRSPIPSLRLSTWLLKYSSAAVEMVISSYLAVEFTKLDLILFEYIIYIFKQLCGRDCRSHDPYVIAGVMIQVPDDELYWQVKWFFFKVVRCGRNATTLTRNSRSGAIATTKEPRGNLQTGRGAQEWNGMLYHTCHNVTIYSISYHWYKNLHTALYIIVYVSVRRKSISNKSAQILPALSSPWCWKTVLIAES